MAVDALRHYQSRAVTVKGDWDKDSTDSEVERSGCQDLIDLLKS